MLISRAVEKIDRQFSIHNAGNEIGIVVHDHFLCKEVDLYENLP